MKSRPPSPLTAWQQFAFEKEKYHYPIWPNEVMVKVLFGDYIQHKLTIKSKMRVLDVGCGFGNNLLPFLVRGCHGYGTEVTEAMTTQTRRILKGRGFSATIKQGTNDSLPFSDDFFDLLISLNVIHYEPTYVELTAGLREYRRVIKPGGKMFLMTVGKNHDIITRAKKLRPHIYQIQNYDFRDGTGWFCFEDQVYLKVLLRNLFREVETGEVVEQLMKRRLNFLIATATK